MSGPAAMDFKEYGEMFSEENPFEMDDDTLYHEQTLSDDELLQGMEEDFGCRETPHDLPHLEDACPEDIQNEETQQLRLNGILTGHSNWVTQISASPVEPNMILSSSRDKSVILWQLERSEDTGRLVEKSRRVLRGHSHFVSDVVWSSKGLFALSGSWDKDLRLWDLEKGSTAQKFKGHQKDVLSVSFSADDRQVVSGSRDKTIRLWNNQGKHQLTFEDDTHTDWVSCIRFSPLEKDPTIVSGGWDKTVKVWDLQTCTLKTDLHGHSGYLNCVAISPDGALCVSGGKDGLVHTWDLLSEGENYKFTLDNQEEVNALCYNPTRLWLSVAAGTSIKIWDLRTTSLVEELRPKVTRQSTCKKMPTCTSLAWSMDGQVLFAGYTDNVIRVWEFCLLKGQTHDSHKNTGRNTPSSVPADESFEGVDNA